MYSIFFPLEVFQVLKSDVRCQAVAEINRESGGNGETRGYGVNGEIRAIPNNKTAASPLDNEQ